jgi:hypothetical protein
LINHRTVFLIELEAGGWRSGCHHGRVLVRVLFQVAAYLLLIVLLSDGKAEKALWLPRKALISFMRALLS